MEQDKRATARERSPREAGTLRDLRPPRFAVGLTQEDLAERATLSARAVSDLERGLRTRPQRETIRLLAEALRLNPDERDNLLAAARPAAAEPPTPPPIPLVPGNLPTPPTPLIGRAEAVAAAVHRLHTPEVRLLTITGPGGVGKSRLALAIAEVARPEFPQGVFFVALAPLTDPALLVTAIAEALDIVEEGQQSLHDTVLAALREQRLLLLLDNFEHLLPAVAFVDQILATCRGVKILATSRAALPSPWQHEEPVPPLTLPATGLLDMAALSQIPAVALFSRASAGDQAGIPTHPGRSPGIPSRSASASTGCRWHSNWRRRACAFSRPAPCSTASPPPCGC
jgi:DNA-binding XRE family transcriptional regulator